MNSWTHCLVMWLLVSGSLKAAETPTVGVALSTCDLANDPRVHSGETIRLKGQIVFDRHGAAVFDENCPTVVLGGFTWSNAVVFGGARSDAEDEPLRIAAELYLRRSARGKHPYMHGILVGKLHVVESFLGTGVRNGRALGSGFGHLGAVPFRLAVERLECLTFCEEAKCSCGRE